MDSTKLSEYYQSANVESKNYFQNIVSIRNFKILKNTADINKPVDKSEWGMTPPTVNAYYSPSYNEIVFPAGILQGLFFNAFLLQVFKSFKKVQNLEKQNL